MGIEGNREFLKRIGLLDRLKTELPEVARPTEPKSRPSSPAFAGMVSTVLVRRAAFSPARASASRVARS